MGLQLVPIPFGGFGNPIWATASATLNEPIAARFTVDFRATMLSLAQYNVIVATALVSAIVSLERQRAAQFLYALVGLTILVSILAIRRAISSSHDVLPGASAAAVTDAMIAATLGVILSTAMAIRALDRLQRRQPRSVKGAMTSLLAAVLSLIFSMGTILICADPAVIVAALLGTGTLIAIVAIRKWFLGFWGIAGAIATASIILVASFTVIPIKKNADLTIALSTQNQPATERMLQDVRPLGSGAGTFNALFPVYRDVSAATVRERPTAAAAIAIEMGRAFLCGLLIFTMVAACTLFKRSLSRGYDYVFPAAGAGASISLLILPFGEDGMLEVSVSLLIAALYGLAFGQSLASQDFPEVVIGKRSRGWSGYSAALRNSWTRIALGAVGAVLIAQAAWLTSQWWHFGAGLSTVGATVASDALTDNEVARAASIGPGSEALRAAQRFTAAAPPKPDELDLQRGQNANATRPSAGSGLTRVLYWSPLRGDIWLMLAAASKPNSSQSAAMLRMSYYTAPNDLDLMPLRVSVALATDVVVRDLEFRDLIKRDVSLVVTHRPALRPTLVAAYRSASADGKIYLEGLISELDPTYLDNMRTRSSRQGSR
ncbi:hypothetical protein [Bradyrhizobium shewense]|nr:hypothetical protein [Bradyrhizobium shewense]